MDQRGYARLVDGDNNGSLRCDIGAYEVGASQAVTTTYLYDNLYRLTTAKYSTGLVFTYTYDAVGNRLTQTVLTDTTVFTYDVANRLTNLDGIAYTWDNNGNLLSGGGYYTYTYDTANHLVKFNQGAALTYTMAYNGQGDRVSVAVNGVPMTYTLDLNAGLTQILADGTNTYLYGNGRIAQQGLITDYFLTDALGSVRQLASGSGAVALSRWYDPYGNILSNSGSATTVYGFTGEWGGGLIDLRARWYSPAYGRFIQKDVWGGDANQPMSYNAWLYVDANPINLTDPSGHCVFVGPACVIFVAGVAIVVYVAALPASQYLVEHSGEIAEEVEDIIGECERIVEEAFRKPFAWPIGDPFVPPLPQPQPTTTREPRKVLIVGEASTFDYAWSLHREKPDLQIMGTSYGSGNSQDFYTSDGNLVLVKNVDAKRLEQGRYTNSQQWAAIIFNNPHTGTRRDDAGTAALISAFIRSAKQVLAPSGEMHINVSVGLLSDPDYTQTRAVLGVRDTRTATLAQIRNFGDTEYYAPYVPRYASGTPFPGFENHPELVAGFKNFVFP